MKLIKNNVVRAACIVSARVWVSVANAGLIDRGNGMIYDDVLDVTWLQNANLGGRLNWSDANAWADSLVYAGYDDWRLTTVFDQGSDGCNYADSGTDCGFNVTTVYTNAYGETVYSELAYMLYENLGNTATSFVVKATFDDAETGQEVTFNNLFFTPVQDNRFWTGTAYTQEAGYVAWFYDVGIGFQGASEDALYQTWAVRDGDVTVANVAEPATVGLLVLAVAGLVYRRRKA